MVRDVLGVCSPLNHETRADEIADCKFNHPASRPTPKAKFGAGKAPYKAPSFGNMNKSKKFGSAASSTGGEKKTLNPSAGSFVPKEVAS